MGFDLGLNRESEEAYASTLDQVGYRLETCIIIMLHRLQPKRICH